MLHHCKSCTNTIQHAQEQSFSFSDIGLASVLVKKEF